MTETLKFVLGCPEQHLNDEYIDHVEIKIEERFKTSGLSGDEWRFNAVAEFYRKGTLLWTSGFRNMADLGSALSWIMNAKTEAEMMREPADEVLGRISERRDQDRHTCFHPGCARDGIHFFRMKKRHSRGCHFEKVLEPNERHYRCFCEEHKHRGDAGLNDSDAAYIPLFSLKSDRALKAEHFQARAHSPVKIRGGYLVEFPRDWAASYNPAHAVSEDPS